MTGRASSATPGIARWEHFEHSADVGIRGYGASMAEAFTQAALALVAIVTDPAAVEPEVRVEFHCTAPDRELLLVTWLDAVIYGMSVKRLVFARFEVVIRELVLSAVGWGERVDRARHRPAVEAKGATLTALEVRQEAGMGWLAQCIVDV